MNNKYKINLIFSKRGRDNYLRLVLHNLNLLDDIEKFDVIVYIVEDIKDNINKIDYSVFENLKIDHFYTPNLPEVGDNFCRAHLSNIALQRMRQDYDWLSIMDTDIVYRKEWLKHLAEDINSTDRAAVRCHGHSIGSAETYREIIKSNYNYDELRDKFEDKHNKGPSQLSIHKLLYDEVCKVLGMKTIYDFESLGYDFIGHGHEDITAWSMIRNYPQSKIIYYHSAWCHVWHEPQPTNFHNKNYKYYKEIKKLYKNKLMEDMSIWQRLSYRISSWYKNRTIKDLDNYA